MTREARTAILWAICLAVSPLFTALSLGQPGRNVLPEFLGDLRIGSNAERFLRTRPGIPEHPVLKQRAPEGTTVEGLERSYTELLQQNPLFSDATYGVKNDVVSYVYLVGPPSPTRYSLAACVASLVDGAIRKYGTNYRVQTKRGVLPGAPYEWALLSWTFDDVTVGISVPTASTIENATGGPSAQSVGRFRFVAFASSSVIAPALFGFEARESRPQETADVDQFMKWLASVRSDAPVFK